RSRRRTLSPVASSKADAEGAIGIVYMSGDDLSHLKLTADLLMDRWILLRDKLSSRSLSLLHSFSLGHMGRRAEVSESLPDDQTLKAWFDELYQIEQRAQCTLWIPSQLLAPNEALAFRPELGLNIEVTSAEQRNRLLLTWHIRRWLVSMMSTAGHSQDTAINLVDMALRLRAEGLAARTVFYLIQNKYDNSESNRPS